jgi:site-specific recombinase XerD
MQYCNKSKTESKEGVSMDDKTEFVRMATTQCLKYMSVNEANKVEQILSVLLTKYSLKKETYALSTETVTPNQKLVNTFLAIKKISGLTDKSLKAYNNEIQMMLKAINKPIADIKVNDIRAYLAFEQLNKNVSNSYLDTKLRYLKSFFKTLRIEGYIPNDPAEKITKIKAEKVIRKPFTPIETEKIRDAAGKDLRLKAIIEFLLSTGCRVTEVENANRSDIKDDKLIITGKGNKQRYVYLNAQAKLALEKYENTRSDTNNALFVSKVKIKGEYKRLEKGQIENIIRELGKDIEIENCHPHRFRRTMATDALRAGMPIEQVSLMLGHEELTTTQIYARSDESDVYQAHQKYVR